MTEAVLPEQQIEALRRELAARDAIIAAGQADRAEAALLKVRLTTALLEIERIKLQLAVCSGACDIGSPALPVQMIAVAGLDEHMRGTPFLC